MWRLILKVGQVAVVFKEGQEFCVSVSRLLSIVAPLAQPGTALHKQVEKVAREGAEFRAAIDKLLGGR